VPLVVVFVQAILLAFEVCVILGMLAWRYPRVATVVVLLGSACVALGPRMVAAILVYTPVALAGWYLGGWVLLRTGRTGKVLALWRGLVGRRLHASWRRWTVYERRWQKTLERHNLTEPRERGLDKVPRYRVRTGPFGDTLRVKVLRGQYARDFTGLDGETAKALAKAFNARECRVSDEPQSDWITLWLPRGKDPLATPVPFPGVPKTTAEVDLSAVPIGVDEKGRQVKVPVLGSHLLVAAITGGGKGSALYSVLLHLVPFIREGSVRVWIVDPKRGVELAPISALAYRFEDRGLKEIGELLAELVTVMDASADRLKVAKLRKLSPTPDHPLNVVIVDELGRLSDDKECQGPLKELINVGRAPGVSVIGALQTPTKEVAKFRDEIPVKWVGRMESKEYVRLCLGREAVLNGAAADEIPMSMPGAGYLKIDRVDDDDETSWLDRTLPWRRRRLEILSGRAMEPTRMRCYHVTDDLIADVNALFSPDDATAIEEVDDPPVDAGDGTSVALEPVAAGGGGERDWDEERVARDRRGRFAGSAPETPQGRPAASRGLYDVDDPGDDAPAVV
jgi:hypothetical protein